MSENYLNDAFDNLDPDHSIAAWAVRAGGIIALLINPDTISDDPEKVAQVMCGLVARMPTELLSASTIAAMRAANTAQNNPLYKHLGDTPDFPPEE